MKEDLGDVHLEIVLHARIPAMIRMFCVRPSSTVYWRAPRNILEMKILVTHIQIFVLHAHTHTHLEGDEEEHLCDD